MERARQPVLFVNLASGGGKAERADLVGHCRARGIEPIVLARGDDLTRLAEDAVRDGADVLGMAGGDGSQSAVAAVAAQHELPFVCVPAGTRNHFAFDVGVDRRDLVGALDAFSDGHERRIDLARINGRVFLNNVALGLYGSIVESPEYRDHKVRTAIAKATEHRRGTAPHFDLRFVDAGGHEHLGADLVVVSNNRYAPLPRPRRGTRGELDRGELGIIAVTGPPPGRLTEWASTSFRVDSTSPVAMGIDGESVQMEPPLIFESSPHALRIRIPRRS